MGVSDEDPYDALSRQHAKNLAASMRQLKDAAILSNWGALDELYEQDFPNPEEETK